MGRKKKKTPKILNDHRGPFYWETYFVGGKQKRRKIRGFVLDNGVPVDRDDFLRANATDLDLHQLGEYELLHEREMAERGKDEAVDASDDDDLPF